MANEILATVPKAVNVDQLKEELLALGVEGVKAYAVFGASETCVGVYAWAGAEGVYDHATVSEADKARIVAAIDAHVPAEVIPAEEQRLRDIEEALALLYLRGETP